jgi:hypothetical protein
MKHPISTGWIVLIGIVVATGVSNGPSQGAEFRTTLVGVPTVRQASYEIQDRDVAPAGYEPAPATKGYASSQKWISPQEPSCGAAVVGNCGYWGGLEFLMWWRQGQDVPALLTTSPSGTSFENTGILGNAGTQVLYGHETHGEEAHAGGRLTLGKWLDSCQILGMGTRLYALGEGTSNYQTTSNDIPLLARPFRNVTTNLQDSDVLAYPGVSTATVSISNASRLGGGDVYFRRLFYTDACRRIDLVAGYQFSRINQDLTFRSSRISVDPAGSIPVDTVVDVEDLFATKNEFHAGEIGLLAEYDRGFLTWSLLAKVGLGRMRQRVSIDGETSVTVPGQSAVVTDQGLLALDTNIGEYSQSVFAVSPEVALTAAYHLNHAVDLTVGYSFIYWNRVAQPSAQIDTALNTTQIAGTLAGEARPAFEFQDSGYFVQGLNFGISWVY